MIAKTEISKVSGFAAQKDVDLKILSLTGYLPEQIIRYWQWSKILGVEGFNFELKRLLFVIIRPFSN